MKTAIAKKVTYSERIKKLRNEFDLTQDELARQTGFSQSTIVSWETGKCSPSADAIILLSDFFEVSSDYLLGRTNMPN